MVYDLYLFHSRKIERYCYESVACTQGRRYLYACILRKKITAEVYDIRGVANLWTSIYLLVNSYRQSVLAKFYGLVQKVYYGSVYFRCYPTIIRTPENFTYRNFLCVPAVTFISSIGLSIVKLRNFILLPECKRLNWLPKFFWVTIFGECCFGDAIYSHGWFL